MLTIHDLFVTTAGSALCDPDKLHSIVQQISNLKPEIAGCAAEAVRFVSACSGGEGAPYIKEVMSFAQSLKVRREPADGQLDLLAEAKVRSAPLWPMACYKTLMQANCLF